MIGDRVHGNSDDLDLLLFEFGSCSLHRFDLLGSERSVGDRVKEDGGPWSAEGVFEIDHLAGLGGSGELRGLPAERTGFGFRMIGTACSEQ